MPLLHSGRFSTRKIAPLLTLALAGLSACTPLQTTAINEPDNIQSDEQQTLHYSTPELPVSQTTPHYRPMPADTLYSLLLAELAGQRQRYDVALDQYLRQASKTRDPDIAERAARIAQFVGSQPHAAAALTIWLEAEPDNPAAHQAAAQLEMEAGNFSAALRHLQHLQHLTGISQYDYLAANAGHLPAPQQQQLLHNLQQLRQQQPGNAALWFATGMLNQHLQQYDDALRDVNQALKLQPDMLSAALQKGRVLALLQRWDEALKWLSALRREHPQHKGIQVLQARILLEQRRMDEARDAFASLHQHFPDDTAILLSLALLDEETGNREQARDRFYQLLASQSHVSEAHFYLGRIADDEDDADTAINHFSQVGDSREYLPAQLRAAYLTQAAHGLDAARDYLQQQRQLHPRFRTELLRVEVELLSAEQQYPQALQLLTEALQETPDDTELLYTRAMIAERTADLPALERDLRRVLTLQPDNTEALNALGYALADRTDRWTEALPLIERALQLAPDNPAVIDSLGWVYFRMGQVDKALPLLQKAFSLMPDHEIAAHLGELLWITGDRQQAATVWQQGYEHTPDSDIINRTLERLQLTEDDLNAAHP